MQDLRSSYKQACRQSRILSFFDLWLQRGNRARVCVRDAKGALRVQVPVTIGCAFLLFSPFLMGVFGALAWGLKCSVEIETKS